MLCPKEYKKCNLATLLQVPTSEEAYTNLVSELFPQAPKLGDVFTIPGSQAPPPAVQVRADKFDLI